MNQKPKHWQFCKLGDVCHINMGQSPPSSTYNTDKKGLPFFQGKAEFTELHPVAVKWCTEPKKIAQKDDILISVRAPVGSTNVANQKCAIGRGLAAISFKYSNSYLWYYLKSIEKNLDNQGTGTTFKAIS
ncbi:MAG: restriction endonuclease subunit S, partial [Bacteroidota bacterium]